MSLGAVDDLNLVFIGDGRGSFFDGVGIDREGVRGVSLVFGWVGMASSCGLGGRVASSGWILVGIGGVLFILWVLGREGVEDAMAFMLGEMGESMFSCKRVFSRGFKSSCSLLDGSLDEGFGTFTFRCSFSVVLLVGGGSRDIGF